MKIDFAGAFYKKTEESSFKMKFVSGTKECVLLHFYNPMVITLDGKQIETQANACILYRPGTPQIYWCKNNEFENDYIKFLPADMTFFNDFQIPFDEIFYVTNADIIRREMTDITYFLTERDENLQVVSGKSPVQGSFQPPEKPPLPEHKDKTRK